MAPEVKSQLLWAPTQTKQLNFLQNNYFLKNKYENKHITI